MPTVRFQLADGEISEVECQAGEPLFVIGQRAKIPIDTACVGKGTCGLCRVRVVDGESHLSEVSDVEIKHLGNVYYLTKVRLSCQAVITGGTVTVEPKPKPKTKPKSKQKRR